jgi:hypothetical protein
LRLTRLDGLASNIVFSLAVGSDGAVWAATDDGVSRIESEGQTITTFTALDGLALPARDIAVDQDGTAWVATDGGLFRIRTQSGQITGVVQDTADQPVESATILVHGTSVQTVTDGQGRFRMGGIPPGTYLLQADGRQATSGAFAPAFREVTVHVGMQELVPLVLEPIAPRQPVDVAEGGVVTFPEVPGAALDIPPQTAQFPEGAAAAIGLTLLPLPALPRSLPSGFTGIVAAEIDSPGLSFTAPARLTLPTVGPLSPGDLLVLLCLDETTGIYEPLGLGRVSGDGTVIEPLSGGVRHACTVVYARTGPDGTKVFLLPVSGNQQQAEPGEELPEPLVVRLEDQFGNPITDEPLAADILQGVGDILEPDLITDAQGQAAIRVQVGPSEEDLIVQVRPPDLPRTQPVHFFSIVGELDTPDVPIDLAIADDDVLLVADRRTGLLVLDIRNPIQPVHLHTLPPSDAVGTFGDESVWSVIVQRSRAYLGIGAPAQLYVVDLTDPRHPDFTADADGDGTADVIRALLDFPGDVLGHVIRDLAVRGPLVYALSNTFSDTPASLYIVDVQEPTQPQLVPTVMLPTSNPTGMALAHDFLYVAAEAAGLLTFDLSDPTRPTLVHTLGDPDPQDDLDITLTSDIATEGERLYVVETQRQATDDPRDHLVVMDLSTPSRPRRQGRVQLTTKLQLTLSTRGLAVAPPFAYIARGFFGLEALDIRDPETPRQVGFVTTPSNALQVITSDTFVYVTDQIFGLQIIQGPAATEGDTDGDGSVDFFDAFPTDPLETQDTDGDRLGSHADADDDNDSFSDAEEAAAMPPTDPLDPLSFSLRVPPPGVHTVVVDATSPPPPSSAHRHGGGSLPLGDGSDPRRTQRSRT